MNDSLKRQVFPPGLWVVATPIGNLGDLAPRAEQALRQAQAVLCEDTRRTAQLLSGLGIAGKRLERLDAHAAASRIEEVAGRLAGGETLALVSDAGTPAISDPGSRLVARARELGVTVTPFPGPSAPVVLLSVAGFDEPAFAFRGFFPRKKSEQEAELALVRRGAELGIARVYLWFESPERIADALERVAELLPGARLVAAKELTKLHERVFGGGAEQASAAVRAEVQKEGARGEWCFALRLDDSAAAAAGSAPESSDWVKALHCLLNAQVSASVAAKQVSQQFGVSRNRVYEEALRLSGKKISEGG